MTKIKSELAKVHEEVATAKREFVPSTGDESYLQQDPSTLPDDDRASQLFDLQLDINEGYQAAIGIARKATARMLEVGKDLCKARAYFRGDKEFGQWRNKHINFSQSHCQRLMQVAREFGDNEDALALPVGTLSELCTASPELKEKIIEKAKTGEKTTRAEVTKAKKAEKSEPSSLPEGGKSKIGGVMKAPSETPEQRANKWLALPAIERISGLEVRGTHSDPMVDAFLMFGIPPFHEGMPSIDTIHFLWHGIGSILADEPELTDKFTVAYDYILDLY